MEGYRNRLALLVALTLFAASGASCPPRVPSNLGARPRVLPPRPTLAQVIDAVNANSSRIQSLHTSEATLSGQGFPTLRRTTIAFERPGRLRLRAGTGVTGTELDLGSNDDVIWLWVKRQEPKAVLYCRHEQFARSPIRRQLPVEPAWLIEALGVVYLDPTAQYREPIIHEERLAELRSMRSTPEGPALRVTLVNLYCGTVAGLYQFDTAGELTASAVVAQQRRDEITGLYVPKIIDIACPQVDFQATIDLGNMKVNHPMPNGSNLWVMPTYKGSPPLDLASQP